MKYILLLFFLNSIAVSAQNFELSGKVLVDSVAMEFALVRIIGENKGARTDKNGEFRITDLKNGEYLIVTSLTGYENDSTVISLPRTETPLEIRLNAIAQEVAEITVSSNLRETALADSPIAIEIISPRLFQRNPNPGLFESVGMVNGVRPQLQCNVCNTGDIHINGMEGPYTMVMIDGMPIVSALGSVYGLMGIPNNIIERVEIQKGPASTLYGSEAMGGLINVITKKADCGPRFTFDSYLTSYMESNTDIGVGYKVGKKLSAIFSANYFHFDRRYDINKDNFTDVTLQKRIALFNKFNFTHKSGKQSQLALRYYYEDRWGGEMQWNADYRGGDSVYGESIFTNRFELLGASPLKLFGSEFTLSYSYIKHDQNSAYGNTTFNAIQDIAFTQITKHIDLKRQRILIGTALRYTFYDDNTAITASSDSLQSENRPSSTFLPGVFVQDEIALTEKNSLLLGLRYDYNSLHGSILSPRLNWKYNANTKNIFRLGIGNGYRVVNVFSEDHAAFTGAREVVILNSLNPEQSWSANFNYSGKKRLKKAGVLGIELNLFYTYFSNKIVADYFTNADQVIFDNLDGYGINRGGGIQVNWMITNSLKATVAVTYTDLYLMEKDSSNTLKQTRQVQTPPLTGNFNLAYEWIKAGLNFDLTGNVYSPMLLPVLPNDYRPEYSPWFALINVQITKKIKNWEIYGGCKNLLNYLPKEDPILRAHDPFDKLVNNPIDNPNGYTFDPGYNYAPIQATRLFLGVRLKL